jgi:hypothetical protein
MPNHPHELPLPQAIHGDAKAKELIRVWASEGQQQLLIAGKVWDDPAAWGILLVDLARHVANCYAAQSGMETEQTLARIKQGFDVEWSSPT